MHFSKTYTQLLLSLPPELRTNAIEYRQLKKLINQVVQELSSLGLSPEILHTVLHATTSGDFQSSITDAGVTSVTQEEKGKGKEEAVLLSSPSDLAELTELLGPNAPDTTKVQILYEFPVHGGLIEPRLRLRVGSGWSDSSTEASNSGLEELPPPRPIDEPSDERATPSEPGTEDGSTATSGHPLYPDHEANVREYLIALPADSAFFQLLSEALQGLSSNLNVVRKGFLSSLDDLSRSISTSARPVSEASGGAFQPHSHSSDPADVQIANLRGSSLLALARHHKSDLYTWREIFQLYIDAEIFQSHGERTRGDRSIEETEERLKKFTDKLVQSGFTNGKNLALKESRTALQLFLQLNAELLDIKKLQYANTEAIRKILKKHTKRTALPFPLAPLDATNTNLPTNGSYPASPSQLVSSRPLEAITLFTGTATSLPRLLIQAMGETLLPIIPSVDDYSCLICTSLAFKPIRLNCGHLFCVRCLVKLQKKGKGNCPMCRAPTVLQADRTNVDWALLNFMKDWFPIEAKEKLKQNEREAAREQMEELGFSVEDSGCVIT